MDRLVAIGDIHGCVHTLKDLLNRVSYSSQTDTLVFIGDYIDRGYFSYEVVSMLIKLRHQVGKDKVVCLRGNHEQMAIDAYRHGNYPLWYRNGGRSTEYSFEKKGQDLANAVSWFETLPLVYDTPEIIFCHAGLSYSFTLYLKVTLITRRQYSLPCLLNVKSMRRYTFSYTSRSLIKSRL